jgi:hypothetical protein
MWARGAYFQGVLIFGTIQYIFFSLNNNFFYIFIRVGYVHFSNQLDGKKFYAEMKIKSLRSKKKTNIEFIQDGIENNENDPLVQYRI